MSAETAYVTGFVGVEFSRPCVTFNGVQPESWAELDGMIEAWKLQVKSRNAKARWWRFWARSMKTVKELTHAD